MIYFLSLGDDGLINAQITSQELLLATGLENELQLVQKIEAVCQQLLRPAQE